MPRHPFEFRSARAHEKIHERSASLAEPRLAARVRRASFAALAVIAHAPKSARILGVVPMSVYARLRLRLASREAAAPATRRRATKSDVRFHDLAERFR